MTSSRVRRLGASILLSLVMVAGSASAAWGADPSAPAPSPSDSPMVTVAPSPSDSPTLTETPAPSETPVVTESPSPSETPTPSETPAPSATPIPAVVPTKPAPGGNHPGVECLPTSIGMDLPAGYCMTKTGPAPKKPAGAGPAATTGDHFIKGTVTAAGGGPAAGVAVRVSYLHDCYLCADYGDTTTLADGSYSIAEEATDGYVVMFFGQSVGSLNGYYDSGETGNFTVDSSKASELDLTSSDATGINVTLRTGLQITGKIGGGTSAAVAGVWVYAYAGTSDPFERDLYFASALTGSDGTYTLYVPNGTFGLEFWDDSARYLNGYYAFGSPGNFSLENYTDVVVSSSNKTGVNATLGTGHFIKGLVTGSDAQPLADVYVYIEQTDDPYYSGGVSTTSTGTYAVAVPPGTYTVEVISSNPELDGYYSSGSTGHYNEDVDSATELTVGSSDRTPINVQMPTGFFIKGKVTGVGGVGLPDVEVTAVPTGIGDDFYWTSAADGTYVIPVPAGTYTVYFGDYSGHYLSGYYASAGTGHFALDLDSATSVTMVATDIAVPTVQLETGYVISGTVTGVADAPLEGIEVQAYTSPCSSACYSGFASTGSNGHYSVMVPPGTYQMSFIDQNDVYVSASLEAPVDATTGSASGIDFQMQIGYHIQGTVSDADGTVAGIQVEADKSGSVPPVTFTDTDGFYDFLVGPGSYTISFEDDTATHLNGYYDKDIPGNFTTVAAGATPVVVVAEDHLADVTLGTGFTIKGTVTGEAGAPLQGVQVGVTSTDYSGSVLSASDGTFSVAVVPGTYTANFYVDHYFYGFYSTGGFTTNSGDASPVDATTGNANGIDVQMYGPPAAPTNVTGIGYDSSIVVSWTASVQYGKPVTGYRVYMTEVAPLSAAHPAATTGTDPVCTTTNPAVLSCSVTGLTNGQLYSFTVIADSSVGASSESDPSDPVMPRIGNSYFPLAPARILNSAANLGVTGKLHKNVPVTFQVTGHGGVGPDATAVTGVLTVIGPSGGGAFSITPTPVPAPTTSNLNFPKGDSRSTGVTVTLGPSGTLSITYTGAAAGTADAYFDVTGYFAPGSAGATYKTVTPNRLVDSRVNNGISGKLTAGKARTFTVVNRTPSVPSTNVPTTAIAVTGNLTVTAQTAAGHLTLTPAAQNSPATASIYFPKGDNRATGLTMMLGPGGTLSVTYVAGAGATTAVIFDVTGYFVPGQSGAMYIPVTPNRLVDSRSKVGLSGKLTPFVSRAFQVTDRVPLDATKNIPASAVAITGTLTVTNQTITSWLGLTPTLNNHPATSTLNFLKGDNRATGVTVPLGPGGKECVVFGGNVKGSTTDVVFDVSGYFVN